MRITVLPSRIVLRTAIVASVLLVGACSDDSQSAGGTAPHGSDGPAPSPIESSPGISTASGGTAGGAAVATGGASGASLGAGGAVTATPEEDRARPGLVARISKSEYAHSVFDVLGVQLLEAELDPLTGGIPDDAGDGVFKHLADKQVTLSQHASSYFIVAEAVAGRIDLPALTRKYGGCSDETPDCASKFIAGVGRRLFRRPLREREVEVFAGLFGEAVAEQADFHQAVGTVLQAQLQAPQFLFRLEDEVAGTAGVAREVTDLELATRLASFLWVSVPDDELLLAAEQNTLRVPAIFDAQLARMLADTKTKRLTEAFIADFSRARLASFKGVTRAQSEALHDSIVATFQYHFWDAGRTVAELFTTTDFVVNPPVAALLGVEGVSGEELVNVSQLPERVGILTHPGSIAGMGDRSIGAFVNRGKYLMERLVCRHPAELPPGLEDQLDSFDADTTGFNEHERVAARKMIGICWGCHSQFDPFAFGFSRFDGAGRHLGEQDEQGKPLPLDGWVPLGSEQSSPHYSTMTEYMEILSAESVVQNCMTEHFISFATARSTDVTAKTQAKLVGAEYVAGGSTLTALLGAVVRSALFQGITPQAAASVGNQ